MNEPQVKVQVLPCAVIVTGIWLFSAPAALVVTVSVPERTAPAALVVGMTPATTVKVAPAPGARSPEREPSAPAPCNEKLPPSAIAAP